MKKGITPVVATILLLIIVIAIVGYSFGFFQRIFTTAGTTAESEIGGVTGNIKQAVSIDSVSGTSLYLRNTGTAALGVSGISAYVNGVQVACDWGTTTTIGANEVKGCTLASACASGSSLRVTTAGLVATATC
jgi:flagellin-like protein